MKLSEFLELVLLASLWGASFLFMRVAAPEFGPVALAGLRVVIAAVVLTLIFVVNGGSKELTNDAIPLLVVGILNAALPFTLFAFATISLAAGFSSILNATAPFFTAIVAYLWLRERLTRFQVAGLVVGFGGVAILLWGKQSFETDASGLAVAAALIATLSYGFAANYARKYLSHASPMTIATGSQIGAALALLPLALWLQPAEMPSPAAWSSAVALGVLSTALAFVVYFHLIRNTGATRAISVTFLIPVFGMLWGMLFLDEEITVNMAAGTVIILVGTAMTTSLLSLNRRGADTGSG